jgi:hypothetical protein
MVHILCAWLTGITHVRQAVYPTTHGHKEVKEMFIKSRTPREFIRKVAQYAYMDPSEIEDLFD